MMLNYRYPVVFDNIQNAKNEIGGQKVAIEDLKKGNIFRLYEQDGTPVFSQTNQSYVYIADTNSFIRHDGIWAIKYLSGIPDFLQ